MRRRCAPCLGWMQAAPHEALAPPLPSRRLAPQPARQAVPPPGSGDQRDHRGRGLLHRPQQRAGAGELHPEAGHRDRRHGGDRHPGAGSHLQGPRCPGPTAGEHCRPGSEHLPDRRLPPPGPGQRGGAGPLLGGRGGCGVGPGDRLLPLAQGPPGGAGGPQHRRPGLEGLPPHPRPPAGSASPGSHPRLHRLGAVGGDLEQEPQSHPEDPAGRAAGRVHPALAHPPHAHQRPHRCHGRDHAAPGARGSQRPRPGSTERRAGPDRPPLQ